MRTGRLNAFQKVMLQWGGLHPYNATHTYKLAGPLRLERLREAIRQTYQEHQLGVAHLTADGQGFRHEADPAPEVEVLSGAAQGDALAKQVSRELNRPFERPVCRPFRFSVLEAGPQAHYLVLAYDHWAADSVAARLLSRHVLGRYLGLSIPENQESLDLYPATYRSVFHRRLHGAGLAGAAFRSLRQWNGNRRAWRAACWPSTQWTLDYQHYTTFPGTATRLREFARQQQATVHDVLLAALGLAMVQHLPARGQQQGLALGSIVDTRGAAEAELSQTMGVFLGYYLVREQLDRAVPLDEATRRIAARTGPVKERQGYLDSMLNMQVVNSLWPCLSERVKPHFMRVALPMTAGVSNVLVREPWMNDHADVILDYGRGAPTGPMLPLVITPTTFGDQMNIGVTYRTAGFTQAKIDAIMTALLEQLERAGKAEPSRQRRLVGPLRRAVQPETSPALARVA